MSGAPAAAIAAAAATGGRRSRLLCVRANMRRSGGDGPGVPDRVVASLPYLVSGQRRVGAGRQAYCCPCTAAAAAARRPRRLHPPPAHVPQVPLLDSLKYSKFFFYQFPATQVILKPLEPLVSVYFGVPFASFAVFFAIYLVRPGSSSLLPAWRSFKTLLPLADGPPLSTRPPVPSRPLPAPPAPPLACRASSTTRASAASCASTPCRRCCWTSSSCERSKLGRQHAELHFGCPCEPATSAPAALTPCAAPPPPAKLLPAAAACPG